MYWRQVKSTKKKLKGLPVSAKAILMSKDGKALILRKDNGIPDLPGGKVEEGENLYDALIREIEEEIGYSPTDFDFVASWVKYHKALGDRLVLIFTAQLNKKAKNLKIHLSPEHVWGKFLDADGVEEIGDLQPGFANALQICFSRIGK